MNQTLSIENIANTQPKYKSPPGYDSWSSHIKACAQSLVLLSPDIENNLKSPEQDVKKTVYSTLYKALNDAAPPYYVSHELIKSLFQTSPVLPASAPIALQSLHLMLPANAISKEPACITIYCTRNQSNDVFQVNESCSEDWLMLAAVVRIKKALIGFHAFFAPDFSTIYLRPHEDELHFDDVEFLTWYQRLRITAAKFAINALLILQYQPDLVTVEPARHDSATGFGLRKQEAIPSYFSTRWLGKHYQRKQANPRTNGNHSSPRPHWRKGHWHNFRHGPGREQLKLKWIEPIFVNP